VIPGGNLGGSLNWLTVICLGAVGGAIVSAVAFCADVFSWHQTRRIAHAKRLAKLPTLREYADPWPDIVVLLTRIVLGVLAGIVFRSQVTTPLAAFAVGASAPALLTQLGSARMAKPGNEGTEPSAAPSIKLVELETSMSEEG
jgi:hypothetical protein